MLEGLSNASAEIQGQLLNFTFTTDSGSYSTSTYCRLGVEGDDNKGVAIKDQVIDNDETNDTAIVNDTARFNFLATLCAEYGSTGEIKREGETYDYYSEWYIGGYKDGWNSSTPWCACFLSWAAQGISGAPIFADVDIGRDWFIAKNKWDDRIEDDIVHIPTPGDYIFFDWEAAKVDTDNGDPDHVGVVLYVNGTTIYTIEGNSGGRVAIRSYSASDPRIMGYGVLPWA